MSRRQGLYWILTIPHHFFTPYPIPDAVWSRGQLEIGEGGFCHWQLVVGFAKKKSLASLRSLFGQECHAELTRSAAADEYVWKEETRVQGTQFEFGSKPLNRNDAKDWDQIWDLAVAGDILSIPSDIRIRHYSTIRRICSDYANPIGMERRCLVFWGATGTGKSRRAWAEAGDEAYAKDPRSKFWCGYRGQENVVIDEFRGGIDISHLLRWLDRYPVSVEIKGSSTPLCAEVFWITSNIHPNDWYPDLDLATRGALVRRMVITEFQ